MSFLRVPLRPLRFKSAYVVKHEAYVEKFMDDLMKMQAFIEQGRDDEAMFNLVKSLHVNHGLVLYLQSWYNTPRWSLYRERAAPVPPARVFVNGRRKEYNPERIRRQIDHAERFAARAKPWHDGVGQRLIGRLQG